VVEAWILLDLGPRAKVRDGLNDILASARAISRLVQDPPPTQTVVIERTRTPRWLAACVIVATGASVAALVLSLWPIITG